jgi:hypothetical protein
VRAQWAARRGVDPGPRLARAAAEIAEQARNQPRWGEDLVVRSALIAAQWARRAGRPVGDAARAGLAALDRRLADDPRDVAAWIDRAALEELTGDAARAADSLARAAAIHPALGDGRAFRAALGLAPGERGYHAPR